MTEQKASGVYHTSLSSWSPTRHGQNACGMSNADQVAFPNCSAKTAIMSFCSRQTLMVDFCHFTRRRVHREIQRMLSKLNYLCRSRFLSAISTVSNPKIQEKCLLFSAAANRPHSLHPPAEAGTAGSQARKGTSAGGSLWPSLPQSALLADAGHPVAGELNLFITRKKNQIQSSELARVSRN